MEHNIAQSVSTHLSLALPAPPSPAGATTWRLYLPPSTLSLGQAVHSRHRKEMTYMQQSQRRKHRLTDADKRSLTDRAGQGTPLRHFVTAKCQLNS